MSEREREKDECYTRVLQSCVPLKYLCKYGKREGNVMIDYDKGLEK